MKNIITCCILLLICYSCSGVNDPPKIEKQQELIPLTIGNYWIYDEYDLDSKTGEIYPNNNLYRSGLAVYDTLIRTINNRKIKTYLFPYVDKTLVPISGEPIPWRWALIYNAEDGLHYAGNIRNDSLTLAFDDLIFPYPPVVGKEVTGHRFYYTTHGDFIPLAFTILTTYTCISADSLFSTPIGDFKCIVYKQNYYDDPYIIDEVYYFIKQGIGIIGMVNMIYYKGLKERSYFKKYVLTDYKIGERRNEKDIYNFTSRKY